MRRSVMPLFALLFVVAIAVSVGSGAPPPVDVCGICGLADDEGDPSDQPDATVLDSSLTVTVGDDGTTRWVETATVSEETAERLRREERYRQRVTESTRIVTRPENLTATLDGQQLTVRYRGESAARYPGGVTVFDFDQSSYQPSIGAYRVTVRGPGETTAHRIPDDSERQNGTAVWPTEVTDDLDRTTVVFAPSGPVGAGVAYIIEARLRMVVVGLLLASAAVGLGYRLTAR